MSKTWKKRCEQLQKDGVMLGYYHGYGVSNEWEITGTSGEYRIPNQEFPKKIKDKEAWMHKWKARGLKVASCIDYEDYGRKVWKIFEQSVPKQWITKQTKEENKMSKPTPEQIKSQKIRWAEDFLEHAETGKPMRAWEYYNDELKLWGPWWDMDTLNEYECRRKPEVYTFYWCILKDACGTVWVEWMDTEDELKGIIKNSPIYLQQLTPIKKETVELQGE